MQILWVWEGSQGCALLFTNTSKNSHASDPKNTLRNTAVNNQKISCVKLEVISIVYHQITSSFPHFIKLGKMMIDGLCLGERGEKRFQIFQVDFFNFPFTLFCSPSTTTLGNYECVPTICVEKRLQSTPVNEYHFVS